MPEDDLFPAPTVRHLAWRAWVCRIVEWVCWGANRGHPHY